MNFILYLVDFFMYCTEYHWKKGEIHTVDLQLHQ
jgi:hypothetical protein